MAEIIGGLILTLLVVALLTAGFILHMWHILRDIAQEDAEQEADRLFRDYTEHCQYRVHVQMRIVDEMGRR